jgi:hypothetical protein
VNINPAASLTFARDPDVLLAQLPPVRARPSAGGAAEVRIPMGLHPW